MLIIELVLHVSEHNRGLSNAALTQEYDLEVVGTRVGRCHGQSATMSLSPSGVCVRNGAQSGSAGLSGTSVRRRTILERRCRMKTDQEDDDTSRSG